ncbi:hypothetical protein EV356DRAFT_531657 [Viridothelium virens]|uniref:Uncharacterized protein n=1 Tax=Viridothelium virens TaxID=1048519 RepID=A0A6A6HCG0_VIRVR|nr:hypothetical protein EV356DRAFT_531657 [Viridothelium virens]
MGAQGNRMGGWGGWGGWDGVDDAGFCPSGGPAADGGSRLGRGLRNTLVGSRGWRERNGGKARCVCDANPAADVVHNAGTSNGRSRRGSGRWAVGGGRWWVCRGAGQGIRGAVGAAPTLQYRVRAQLRRSHGMSTAQLGAGKARWGESNDERGLRRGAEEAVQVLEAYEERPGAQPLVP